MEIVIEFNESAFWHGISKEDIANALKTKVYAASLNGLPEKYVVIGFSRNGTPLEIMYNPIDDDSINVFHAMKARKSVLSQLSPGGGA